MLAAGSDNPEIKTVNVVGMTRRGLSKDAVRAVKRAHRLIYREHKRVEVARQVLDEELGGNFPEELTRLFEFLELQQRGKLGRAREAFRDGGPPDDADEAVPMTPTETSQQRRAA
jgi:UDP-N-acetylglucosamine acyltransferase